MLSLIVTWLVWFQVFTWVGMPHDAAVFFGGLCGFMALAGAIDSKNKGLARRSL